MNPHYGENEVIQFSDIFVVVPKMIVMNSFFLTMLALNVLFSDVLEKSVYIP